MKRTLAAAHFLLISPAVLFLTAVLAQRVMLVQNEPAQAAQHIVMWYAHRMWTLWILLLALPLSVLITGCIALLRNPSGTVQVAGFAQKAIAALHSAAARRSVAVTTVTAAVIVGIVILHMLAN
jgi:hypothetical protein